MGNAIAVEQIETYLRALTVYPDRRVGGEGNKAATRFFADTCRGFGYDVQEYPFSCLDWVASESRIGINGRVIKGQPGPYSNPFNGRGRLVPASTVSELETADARGQVLLLHGEIARHQLTPKNFPFYSSHGHQRIIRAVEAARPAAVIAATGVDPDMVGAVCPFPLFDDADIGIPNACITEVDGGVLKACAGAQVRLVIESKRISSIAEHVTAFRAVPGAQRIVLSAHIDSYRCSPGAIDNASGVAVLLGAAALLKDYQGHYALEFMPFNGEDNYASPGEMLWLEGNRGCADGIALGVNLDGVGMRGASDLVSFYDCPLTIENATRVLMDSHADIAEGEPWHQGDHMLYVTLKRPALAVSSSGIQKFLAEFAHTRYDTIGLVDPVRIARMAGFLADLVLSI